MLARTAVELNWRVFGAFGPSVVNELTLNGVRSGSVKLMKYAAIIPYYPYVKPRYSIFMLFVLTGPDCCFDP